MSIKISQGESSHLGRCWDIYRDGIHNSCVYGALLCTSVLNTLNESIFHSYNLDIHFMEVERLRGISENNNKKNKHHICDMYDGKLSLSQKIVIKRIILCTLKLWVECSVKMIFALYFMPCYRTH